MEINEDDPVESVEYEGMPRLFGPRRETREDRLERKKTNEEVKKEFEEYIAEEFGGEAIQSGFIKIAKREQAMKDGKPYGGLQEHHVGYIPSKESDKILAIREFGKGPGSYILKPCNTEKRVQKGRLALVEIPPTEEELEVMEIKKEIAKTKDETKLIQAKKERDRAQEANRAGAGNGTLAELKAEIAGLKAKDDTQPLITYMMQQQDKTITRAEDQRKEDEKQRKHDSEMQDKRLEAKEKERKDELKREDERRKEEKKERDREHKEEKEKEDKEFKLRKAEQDKKLELLEDKVSEERKQNQLMFAQMMKQSNTTNELVTRLTLDHAKEDRETTKEMRKNMRVQFDDSLQVLGILRNEEMEARGLESDNKETMAMVSEGFKALGSLFGRGPAIPPDVQFVPEGYPTAIQASQASQAQPHQPQLTQPGHQEQEKPMEKKRTWTPTDVARHIAQKQPMVIDGFLNQIAHGGEPKSTAISIKFTGDRNTMQFILTTPWNVVREEFSKVVSDEKKKILESEQAEAWWKELVKELAGQLGLEIEEEEETTASESLAHEGPEDENIIQAPIDDEAKEEPKTDDDDI